MGWSQTHCSSHAPNIVAGTSAKANCPRLHHHYISLHHLSAPNASEKCMNWKDPSPRFHQAARRQWPGLPPHRPESVAADCPALESSASAKILATDASPHRSPGFPPKQKKRQAWDWIYLCGQPRHAQTRCRANPCLIAWPSWIQVYSNSPWV